MAALTAKKSSSLKNAHHTRLDAIDGLRGLAIIAVFLSHTEIPYHFLPAPIPPEFSLVLNQTFLGSGFLGVSILFILSGFLMGYLYPNPKDKLSFIQKRYTRIFPLFITLCIVSLLLKVFPQLSWYMDLIILLAFAFTAHYIWVNVIKKTKINNFSRIVFIAFIILQAIVGLGLFVFSNIYTQEAFLRMSPSIQILITGLSYGTLTFPLAGAIPLFNTLYWTLCVEVLFYLLYPTVFAPLINSRFLHSDLRKIVFLLLMLPITYYVYQITFEVHSMRHIYIFVLFHFLTGITLAYLYRQYLFIFKKIDRFFKKIFYFVPLLLLFLDFMLYHTQVDIFPDSRPLIQILSAIPLTVIMAFALNSQTSLAKVLSSKFLVFVGMISYSIYLCHLITLSIIYSVFTPAMTKDIMQIIEEVFFVVCALILTLCVSYILYQLLEKPYFVKK